MGAARYPHGPEWTASGDHGWVELGETVLRLLTVRPLDVSGLLAELARCWFDPVTAESLAPLLSYHREGGLLTVEEDADGNAGTVRYALTEAGRAHVARRGYGSVHPLPSTAGLSRQVGEIAGVVAHLGRSAGGAAADRAGELLDEALRGLRGLLAEGPGGRRG